MYQRSQIILIIPALNEAETIGSVLAGVNRDIVDRIVVADNGSTDATAERAREHGALVVLEERRGYGSACARALAEAPQADVYIFMDADGSDDPAQIEALLARMFAENADLVIGSRVLGQPEAGALSPVQIFGNALTCHLVRWFWRVSYSDLGPFRAIRGKALVRLAMSDPDFGWTIEMQVKAAQQGLKICEEPVNYRVRRAGRSKVSGNVLGSFRAGTKIMGYVFAAKMREIIPKRIKADKPG